ncbi:MAG: hypothetical protein GWN58_18310, partial [Anaerolineae bacterium]|nr:hypothetical protein [Anaerolineae bacterium]
MKSRCTIAVLLILLLLLSSGPAARLRRTRAAHARESRVPYSHAAASPDTPKNVDGPEQLPFDFAPNTAQDEASTVFGTPAPLVTQSSAAGGWQTECVDCPRYFSSMANRSLQLDDDGHPCIAYGGDGLYYAWYNGAEWQYETVDSAPRVGHYASLALDTAGYPHISYYDGTNDDLKYAYRAGNIWHVQTVDSEGVVGGHTSLALDAAGNPHISYYDGSNDDLKYAHWTGSAWDIQTVDSEGVVGAFASLALDAADNPHISYSYFGISGKSNVALKYAHWTGSVWDIQTVDSEGSVGTYTSLVLDSAGHPHISYYNGSTSDLKYARWTGSAWDIQTVDSDGSVGWDSALALDPEGHPHISYMDHTELRLKYAYWTSHDWDIQIVDDSEFVGWATSLALDGAGHPHISYHD